MGTLLLSHMKKQACSFLQEKYKTARLALTDVTRAELLAEESINNNPWGPDAKTMTLIAEASFEIDDFWRIVDVLHKRFEFIDWKQWRQFYKSLVLLEFLLTHGPEEFADEFQCDSDVIEELGTFQYIDEKGFNWGANMQKRSDNILKLLDGGEPFREARLKALRITKEIQGFGSPYSSTTSNTSSSGGSPPSFGSTSSPSSTSSGASDDIRYEQLSLNNEDYPQEATGKNTLSKSVKELEKSHIWVCAPAQESGSLLDFEDDEE